MMTATGRPSQPGADDRGAQHAEPDGVATCGRMASRLVGAGRPSAVVVVTARELDEDRWLLTDGPGVMAGWQQHDVSARVVFLRTVVEDDPQCAVEHESDVRQQAGGSARVVLEILRPAGADAE